MLSAQCRHLPGTAPWANIPRVEKVCILAQMRNVTNAVDKMGFLLLGYHCGHVDSDEEENVKTLFAETTFLAQASDFRLVGVCSSARPLFRKRECVSPRRNDD